MSGGWRRRSVLAAIAGLGAAALSAALPAARRARGVGAQTVAPPATTSTRTSAHTPHTGTRTTLTTTPIPTPMLMPVPVTPAAV